MRLAAGNLIITRPEPAAHKFLHELDPQALAGMRVIFSPLMKISALSDMPVIAPEAAVIFTSQAAVSIAPNGGGRMAYCVGANTTKTATAAGWHAHQAGETADELVAYFASATPQKPLLHLSGMHVRSDLAERLCQQGHTARQIAIYDQPLLPMTGVARDALASDTPCIAPLFSPRTAMQFVNEAGEIRRTALIAFSEAVAEPIRSVSGVEIHVLARPNIDLMRRMVENLCQNLSLS